MSDCWISDDDLKRLSDSPLLQQLRRLDLRNNRFTEQGLSALLKAADPTRLHWLDVHGNDLNPAAIESLLRWRSSHPPNTLGLQRLTNALGMEFVCVPRGTFLMGSSPEERDRYDDEDPHHAVTLTRPFYLGVYQVTQRQYEQVMGRNPSRFAHGRGGGPFHPVEQISWNDAVEFCHRLAELPSESKRGYRYRLPTEAEWEHACRAGTETPFAFGRTITAHQANFDGNFPYNGGPAGPYRNATAPVGSYRPNAFGLFDMHGNIWEWCQDWFQDDAYGAGDWIDPQGPQYGHDRVLRGGGWYNNAGSCRSAYRYWDQPEDSDDDMGFRVVLIPPIVPE
jgi:formylglycine-generating enzyme required for sulfatase activity